jgi:hypothetical protein
MSPPQWQIKLLEWPGNNHDLKTTGNIQRQMKNFASKTFYTIQQQLRSWDIITGIVTKLWARQPRKQESQFPT